MVYEELGQSFSLPPPRVEDQTENFIHQIEEAVLTYWHHPDHLGSSSYITDIDGNITQHMEYLPFGESLVEEHQNSINTPYKFNAIELDDETGNYYYGARYYDPKFSFWLSVDPLAESMPRWSPYNYVFNNPINLVDPTGMAQEVSEWKLDKNGNLVSEAGDNKTTLAKHLNISKDEAEKMINDQDLLRSTVYAEIGVLENQTLEVDNNIKREINNSKGITIAEAKAGKKGVSSTDSYYCDQGAQMAVNGDEINPKNATNYSQFFPPHMKDFKQVDSFDNVPFNQGIALIGTGL